MVVDCKQGLSIEQLHALVEWLSPVQRFKQAHRDPAVAYFKLQRTFQHDNGGYVLERAADPTNQAPRELNLSRAGRNTATNSRAVA